MSTPQLISRAIEDVSTLVHDEIALAKAEIQQSVKSAAVGAGMFSAAGVLALYGGGALVAAAIAGLATVVPIWVSALIIAVALFAIAAVAVLVGKKKVGEATPPLDATKTNVQRDVETVKGAHS